MIQVLKQLENALVHAQADLVRAEENAASARMAADNRILEVAEINEYIAELTMALAHLEAVSE